MSLFLKIFLWFWLATALVGGALIFVTWATRTEPYVKLWRESVENTMTIYAEAAAEIYVAKGNSGLETFIGKVSPKLQLKAIVYGENGQEIMATGNLPATENLLGKALQNSGRTEFDIDDDSSMVAKRTALPDGKTLVVAAELLRPKPITFWLDTRTRGLRLLAVILMGGLVCYGLAIYLTSPLVKLRNAVKSFAGGNLQTRAGSIAKRRDEIGSLARDFNEMAERIETLISGQKRLTTDISHELRSPLARLNVALELVRHKSNPETLPLLHRIERESLRLNDLIGQLLTLSRLESGTENIEKHQLNLTKIVREIVSDADFEAGHQEKSVKLAAEKDFSVTGNEQLLRSAIENVVRNAVKYTNSSVDVSLKNGNDRVIVTVRDFGAGVPEIELKNLFRPFYRIGEARERNSGGVGLGLAIAERAVLAHDGKISAENADDGGLIIKINLHSDSK